MPGETLKEKLEAACAGRWRGNATARSQARIAVEAYSRFGSVEQATTRWYSAGSSPATINKRLSCLKALGVTVEGMEKVPRQLKWWLNPQDREKLLRWLNGAEEFRIMAAYVRWATLTGLRVEETLRLTPRDVDHFGQGWSVQVPGLKTASSQALLPLSEEAAGVYRHLVRLGAYGGDPARLFPISYDALHEQWQLCRRFLKCEDNPTSTLKALRRTAARYLHVDLGMPLDMVRQYLRHEDIETTMGYLRLTGGYDTEEMRRWVK